MRAGRSDRGNLSGLLTYAVMCPPDMSIEKHQRRRIILCSSRHVIMMTFLLSRKLQLVKLQLEYS